MNICCFWKHANLFMSSEYIDSTWINTKTFKYYVAASRRKFLMYVMYNFRIIFPIWLVFIYFWCIHARLILHINMQYSNQNRYILFCLISIKFMYFSAVMSINIRVCIFGYFCGRKITVSDFFVISIGPHRCEFESHPVPDKYHMWGRCVASLGRLVVLLMCTPWVSSSTIKAGSH